MVYNYEQIKQLLPHRYPFLLVDRITEIKEDGNKKVVIGEKCVSGHEPFFQGHFPQYAVMPGVLILEAMAPLLLRLTTAIPSSWMVMLTPP